MIWNFRRIVGLFVVVADFLLVAGLVFIPIDKETIPAEVWGLLGAMIGWGGAVVNYEFGSSSAGRVLALKDIPQEENQ